MAFENPSFRFWIRRSGQGELLLSLRFEVFEGRGVLRIARPGVLVDPPARVSGYEADLTPQQVRASRFLHVSNYGRRRQTWFLTRITDEAAEQLDRDGWAELMAVSDRGAHHLLFQSPEALQAFGAAAAQRSQSPGSSQAPRTLDVPTLPPEALQPVSIDEGDASPKHQGTRSAPPGPGAAGVRPEIPDSAPTTGLVRHLRRQLTQERLKVLSLQDRIAELERRLQDEVTPVSLLPED